MAEANGGVQGVDAHYAYFWNIYGNVAESTLGLRARNVYDAAKKSNSLLEKTLDGIENKVQDVNQGVVAPLYENYLYSTTDRVVKASQVGLDKTKVALDGAKGVAQIGSSFGMGIAVVAAQISLIVSSTLTDLLLDGFILTRDTGAGVLAKSQNAPQIIQERLQSAVDSCRAAAKVPVDKAAEFTNSLLDVMNAFLDNMLHLPVNETENPESTIPQRISHLTSRVGRAVFSRTVAPAQRQFAVLVENLRQKVALVDVLKQRGSNVKDQLLNTSLSEVYSKLEKEATERRLDVNDLLLKSIRSCSKKLNANLKNIREKSTQALPPVAVERLESAINYVENLDNTLEGAESIHAIRDEVIEEAKSKATELIQLAFIIFPKKAEEPKTETASAEPPSRDENPPSPPVQDPETSS